MVVGANLHLGPTQSTTEAKFHLNLGALHLAEEDMTWRPQLRALVLPPAIAGADVSHRSNECN